VPSPLRPQTTMAMEKLNRAASDAQPRVISMIRVTKKALSVPRLGRGRWTSQQNQRIP
jgi:hypothetical protein